MATKKHILKQKDFSDEDGFRKTKKQLKNESTKKTHRNLDNALKTKNINLIMGYFDEDVDD